MTTGSYYKQIKNILNINDQLLIIYQLTSWWLIIKIIIKYFSSIIHISCPIWKQKHI